MRIAICSLVLLVTSCGAKTNDVASTDASSDTGLPSDCPPSSTDGACTKEGLLCEYGTDYNPQCNVVRVCSGGRWASPIVFGGTPKCPSSPPTIGPNPTECAVTRAGVPDGNACSTKTTCAYDGSVCSCGVFCPSYPIRMPDCDADAGVTTNCCDTTKVAWHCFDGPRYCAANRPRIGTPCTEGDSCAFETATECGQSRMDCRSGVWQMANTSCPVSTATAKKDIAYLSDDDAEHLRQSLLRMPLASYRYKTGDQAPHLGFIIEDTPPGSPAVLPSRDRVDLYGYVTMAVAALQRQEKDIAALKSEVARLTKENAALKTKTAKVK